MALGRASKHDVGTAPSAPPAADDADRWEGDPQPEGDGGRQDVDPLVDTGPTQAPPVGDEAEGLRSDELSQDLPLLDDERAEGFLGRWNAVQARFVDDPQAAVRDADGLVTEVMTALSDRLTQQKAELEAQWHRGDQPQTEELRVALQQYRSFFERLLAT